MPRPFPFPINIGTDICSTHRIFRILIGQHGRFGESFVKKILTPRERLEVPRKILSPIALWKVIAEKRAAFDKKRRELGLESGRSLRKKAPGEPRKLKGHVVRDDAATGKGEEQAEESLGKISSLDIMHNIETEIWEEERVVRGGLKKTAEFLAGRFAAKEAAIKAYHSRRLTYHDIWIQRRKPRNGMSQPPIAVVISEKGRWSDGQVVPMNISHDIGYATAVCMAYDSNPGAVFETAADVSAALASMGEGVTEDSSELYGIEHVRRRIIPISRSIWVSNLSPDTTHLDLEKLFAGHSRIVRAYIARGYQGQSLCYGFVVMDSRRDAFQARQWRLGSIVNGRRITCRLATGNYEYVVREDVEGVISGPPIASVPAARQGFSWKGMRRVRPSTEVEEDMQQIGSVVAVTSSHERVTDPLEDMPNTSNGLPSTDEKTLKNVISEETTLSA